MVGASEIQKDSRQDPPAPLPSQLFVCELRNASFDFGLLLLRLYIERVLPLNKPCRKTQYAICTA